MAKSSKNNDVIVIQKDKLFKVIGISVGLILFIIICFSISANNSEEYSEHNNTATEESSGDDVLQTAIKQAGEISDAERTAPKQINIDKYLEYYNGTSKKVILFSRPTCQYCQVATPLIENIIYKYNIEINYINTDELDDDGNSKLVKSDEYFSEGYGTPLLLIVGDGKIVDYIEGLTTRDEYINFLKKNKIME